MCNFPIKYDLKFSNFVKMHLEINFYKVASFPKFFIAPNSYLLAFSKYPLFLHLPDVTALDMFFGTGVNYLALVGFWRDFYILRTT